MITDDPIYLSHKELFAKIYTLYHTRLVAFALTKTPNRQEAEDAVNDVFLNLWEKRHFKISETKIESYLYKCVRHECINLYLRKKVHGKYLEHIKHFQTANENDSNNPLLAFLDKEYTERLSIVIEKLPEQCRKIYQMSRNENLKYQEIAQKLDVSINTVKTQIKLALQKVRNELKETLNE